MDDEDQGSSCSEDTCYAGSQSEAQITTRKCVGVEVSTSSGSTSSVETVSNSLTSEGTYTSAKVIQASKMQWPKWTVSHMLSLSTMEKVMNYCRVLNLADNLNDEDLLCFLEERISMEKAGLPEMTITKRLRTKLHVSETVGEPDGYCSICMVEYKDQENIASLNYRSHEYHADCIKEWLRKSNFCPMCRTLTMLNLEFYFYSNLFLYFFCKYFL